MKILIVDDENDIRGVTKLALETVGQMEVVDFANGSGALDYLAQNPVDGILLDYMMPGDDGPRVLEKIRSIPGRESIPVIFLTARAQNDQIEDYKALGVAGTITKPYDPMTLAGQVRELFGADS